MSLLILTLAAIMAQLELAVPVYATDCYWRGFPWCGLLAGCDDDHFMYYGWKYCGGSLDTYCCPMGPNKTVVLCEHKDLAGDCISHSVEDHACVDVDKNDWASSINTLGECFRLYEHDKCQGKSRVFYPNAPGVNNFDDVGMNDMVTSVSRCFEGDTCPSGGRRRRYDGNRHCQWIDDIITIGFQALLRRDSDNLQGPVLYYQRGPNGRAEVMEAFIREEHLYTGTRTNQAARNYARRMGRGNDQAGHILASRLGGSGTDLRNIFPQNRNFNQGVWSQIESHVASLVAAYGSVRFTVNLHYDDITATRPSLIFYRIQRGDTDEVIQINDLLNP